MYTEQTFIDVSQTQFHVDPWVASRSRYIFCHESQHQVCTHRINLPLHRILSKIDLRWYGNFLVLKVDVNGAIVDVAPANLPAINAMAIE